MQGKLTDPKALRALGEKYGLKPQKQLGQNFLINPTIAPRMAESVCGDGSGLCVLEIGPGFGVLTRELCARAEKVVAVELDAGLPKVLEETLSDYSNWRLISGDIMKIDLYALYGEEFSGQRLASAANLPYYITTPVIMKLLESRLPFETITVMVQKEAAERLCARPGTRAAGAVSLAVRYYCEPEILFPVSRGSFYPAPNVDSSVIRLTPRKEPPVKPNNEKHFFQTIRAGFGQRRKTLPNALSAGLGIPKEQAASAMAASGIPLNFRAEQLDLEQFCVLSDCLPE